MPVVVSPRQFHGSYKTFFGVDAQPSYRSNAPMHFAKFRWLVMPTILAAGLAITACSRLLPARHGEARSIEYVLDTRRAPSEALSGCFIPAVFPAVTRIPVEFLGEIPSTAVFTSVRYEVILKNDLGEMKVIEPVIENNRVFLKFAVPSADSFTQFHVVVWAKYDYH